MATILRLESMEEDEGGETVSYKEFLASRRSPVTAENYRYAFKKVLGDDQSPDEFLQFARKNPKRVKAGLIKWITEQKVGEEMAPRSIQAANTAVRSFLDYNDVQGIPWKSVYSAIPRPEASTDVPPTKDQLRKLFHDCNVRGKFIVTLLSSSGARVQLFNTSTVKDIEDGGEYGIVHVRKGKTGSYKTCCSKESLVWFREYLTQRKRRGEVVGPDSPLVLDDYGKGRLSSNEASAWLHGAWRRILPLEEANRLHAAHCLRKFHQTSLMHSNGNIPGMPADEVNILQAHARGGIVDVYDKPDFEEKIVPEYLKRQHWLEVEEKYQVQSEIATRQVKVEDKTEELRKQVLQLGEENMRLQGRVNEILSALTTTEGRRLIGEGAKVDPSLLNLSAKDFKPPRRGPASGTGD